MQVVVKQLSTGEALNINVEATEKVSDVKKKIREIIKNPGLVFNLIFSGNVLEDSKTLIDNMVNDKDILMMVIAIPFVETSFNVAVRISGGPVIVCEVKNTDRLPAVKAKIEVKTAIKAANQIVYHGALMLEDTKTLAESGVTNQSTLSIVIQLPGGQFF